MLELKTQRNNKELRDFRSKMGTSLSEKGFDFLVSAVTQANPFNDITSFLEWFDEKKKQQFEVGEIPLDEMRDWYFEKDTGNLRHKSGKFFSIEGVRMETSAGNVKEWSQPIINQPEIGVLGILTKKFNGILYFLMQAKMEPGNINKVQLSPTVQATKSNYSQVHKGKETKYLEYFLEPNKSKVLLDQLQSEQGGRFLKKRNRNIIVEVPGSEEVQIEEDFCWLTLGQIKKLLQYDNIVNMDTRTVISCVYYHNHRSNFPDVTGLKEYFNHSPLITNNLSDFQLGILRSATETNLGIHALDDIRSWFTNLKTKYYLSVKRIPLNKVEKWKRDRFRIFHENGTYFEVIGSSIKTRSREVQGWSQPLIKQIEPGIVGFIVKKINGLIHFLVQAKIEPGNFDIVEMAPTVQCITGSYRDEKPEDQPKYLDLFLNPNPSNVRYRAFQSEEGGRFYHEQNQYLILEFGDEFPVEVHEHYIWMTLGQITEFIKYNNHLNVEARSLISCLSFV